MRKSILYTVIYLLVLPTILVARNIEPAKDVIYRVIGNKSFPLSLSIKKDNGKNYFSYKVKGGELQLQASDNVALCRGFYDYVKTHHHGIYSWSGNNIQLPSALKDEDVRKVVCPFENHYYFNVVTYGYSMPYWNWERWEKEIDWMALHGINMPLALVANEAISARVWAKLGLTNEEIQAYFVGPAHLPWMRMGNISGIDGPLSNDWHMKQIKLQHKILKRMKDLGMKPICPAFAGFIPQAFKRIYPDAQIIETSWGGAFHNWMLSPEEDLFHEIGKLFIQEWEKEFGKNNYYIADSFNEMEIPFPPKDDPTRYTLLASYGEKVYNSIKAGNKDAVWVMQGWMFGYQRDIWDYKTLEALVSKVPDDKMLLLDMAVDYNTQFWKSEVNWEYYKGFYNKPWIYSVIPNMGGKCGMTGVLSFYANGQWDALRSKNKGRLSGIGMAPEGIENNEVIYELLCDAGWSENEINLQQWLKDYSICRYGSYSKGMDEFWNHMLSSVYGTFTDHPRYNWQFRPRSNVKGTIQANDTFFKGIEGLINTALDIDHSPLFTYDLIQWVSAYVGGKLEILTQHIEQAYEDKDTIRAVRLESQFESFMLRMDALLSAYPTSNMTHWINMARAYGRNTQDADFYEINARRIITIWGPPVDDYSARIWGGLIRDYYLPRWKHYFEQKKTGIKFDYPTWEADWVEKRKGVSSIVTPEDLKGEAIRLLKESRDIKSLKLTKDIIGSWNKNELSNEWAELEWNLSSSQLSKLIGLRFYSKEGETTISSISVWADGKKVKEIINKQVASPKCYYPFKCSKQISGNNSLVIRIKMKDTTSEQSVSSSGIIEAVYE